MGNPYAVGGFWGAVQSLICICAVLGHEWCGHDQAAQAHRDYLSLADPGYILKISSTQGSPFGLREQLTVSEPHGLKIYFHYQLLENTPNITYIQETLMPAAAAVLRRTIRVRRPESIIHLMPLCQRAWYRGDEFVSCKKYVDPVCVYAPIPAEHLGQYTVCASGEDGCEVVPPGPGVDADVIVYVTNQDPRTCGSMLAAAAACAFDPDTNRPIAGNIILCSVNPDKPKSDISTAVHELLHILGMDIAMFQGYHFINNEGVKLRENEILHRETRDGREVVSVVTSTVRQVVRDHFQCDTLPGAELEDDGGDGTAGSHWEQRLFEGVIFNPMSYLDVQS